MYDMSRIAGNGYFDEGDNEEARYKQRVAINNQRTEDYKTGEYARQGGVVDPVPIDAPQFLKDYNAYYVQKKGGIKKWLNKQQVMNN